MSAGYSGTPLAKKLGLKNGDVVQQINGKAIDSLTKAGQVLQTFDGLNTFRVSVLRNGRPQMLTVDIQ